MPAEVINNHSNFSKAARQIKIDVGTCKCYPVPTLHFSSIALPERVMILMKTWPPYLTKSSALSARPVKENCCSKPSGFENFQTVLNLFIIMGDLVS